VFSNFNYLIHKGFVFHKRIIRKAGENCTDT